MILDDSILLSLDDCDSISGLKIFCDDSKKEEIKVFFENSFMKEWEALLKQVKEKYGNCLEYDKKINPIIGFSTFDKGILISFDSFLISYSNGYVVAAEVSGDVALEKTLEKLKRKYLGISYEGYIGYRYFDSRSEEVVQYTVSLDEKEDKDKVYEFIGKTLAIYMEDDEFWENFEQELYNYEDEEEFMGVLDSLLAYSNWLGKKAIDKFLDIVNEIDEDIIESLECKINDTILN